MIRDLNTVKKMIKQAAYVMDKKQKLQMCGLFIVIVIGAGWETLGVSVVLPFIQSILSPEELMENYIVGGIAKIFGIKSPSNLPFFIGILLVIVYMVKNLYLIGSSYLQIKFRYKFQKQLSCKMLLYYMKRPYEYFLKINSSEVLRGIKGDVEGLYIVIEYGFRFLSELITASLLAVYLLYTDLFMAIGVVLMSGVSFGVITIVFKKILKGAGEKQRYAQAEINKIAYQTVNGIKEIKVMKRNSYFIKQYEDAYEGMTSTTTLVGILGACPDRIIETICISTLIFLVCIRIGMGGDVVDYVAKLAIFAVAAFRILPCIARMTGYVSVFVYHRPTVEAVYTNFHEVKNQERKDLIKKKKESRLGLQFEKKIEIQQISWHYPSSDINVLENLSIEINKGEVIGLIGESGAGKTTVSDILLGLFHPQVGKIMSDGIDIFDYPDEWAKTIGYVPQTIFLLDDTVRNNILFGVESDGDEKVWEALEMAQCKKFIKNLPMALDTVVGERGIRFSGGQRQRIAIARALYHNPEILILDEATSALDNETETAVMESVEALHGRKTLIIVAHRLTTLRTCDRVYEIKEGQALERDKNSIL